jgi:SAM-dependent methyltransferase
MASGKVPQEIEWHIDYDRPKSELDAEYIDALINLLSRKLGRKLGSILDVPCGNGRLHDYFRVYGYSVYGVDISKELIEQAKKSHPGEGYEYSLGDMRDFSLNKKFDVYLSWFTSFGYFDDKDNIKVLRTARTHLKKNGIIIIELSNGTPTVEYLKTHPKSVFIHERSGEYLSIERPYLEYEDGVAYQVRNESIYKKHGKDLLFVKMQRLNRLRLYSKEDLEKQLVKAGFKVMRTLAGYSFKDFTEGDKRMVMVGIKE